MKNLFKEVKDYFEFNIVFKAGKIKFFYVLPTIIPQKKEGKFVAINFVFLKWRAAIAFLIQDKE